MCTAPELFVKIHPNALLNFREIWLLEVTVGGEKHYMCGPAHVQDMGCTLSICRVVHLPPSGLAALDAFDSKKVNICARQSRAIDYANAWQPDNSWCPNQGVSWRQRTITVRCDAAITSISCSHSGCIQPTNATPGPTRQQRRTTAMQYQY